MIIVQSFQKCCTTPNRTTTTVTTTKKPVVVRLFHVPSSNLELYSLKLLTNHKSARSSPRRHRPLSESHPRVHANSSEPILYAFNKVLPSTFFPLPRHHPKARALPESNSSSIEHLQHTIQVPKNLSVVHIIFLFVELLLSVFNFPLSRGAEIRFLHPSVGHSLTARIRSAFCHAFCLVSVIINSLKKK